MTAIEARFALLDVRAGRADLARRVAAGERVEVVLRGVVGSAWERDDGVSQGFALDLTRVRLVDPAAADPAAADPAPADPAAPELLRVVEVAETPGPIGPPGSDVALTLAWADGAETLEHVSWRAAALLGCARPDAGRPDEGRPDEGRPDESESEGPTRRNAVRLAFVSGAIYGRDAVRADPDDDLPDIGPAASRYAARDDDLLEKYAAAPRDPADPPREDSPPTPPPGSGTDLVCRPDAAERDRRDAGLRETFAAVLAANHAGSLAGAQLVAVLRSSGPDDDPILTRTIKSRVLDCKLAELSLLASKTAETAAALSALVAQNFGAGEEDPTDGSAEPEPEPEPEPVSGRPGLLGRLLRRWAR